MGDEDSGNESPRKLGGMIVAVVVLGVFAYYYYRSKKELGGITGDTAGYFVLLCECSMLVAAAVINVVCM